MNEPLATLRYALHPVIAHDEDGTEITSGYQIRDRYRDTIVFRSDTEDGARAWLAGHREMTPYGHYREAENALRLMGTDVGLPVEERSFLVQVAQIHATLATAPHPMGDQS